MALLRKCGALWLVHLCHHRGDFVNFNFVLVLGCFSCLVAFNLAA